MQIISVVVPAYNENEGVKIAYQAIKAVFDKMPLYSYELIFVDDGSADDTFSYIEEICASNKNVKGLKLLTNCGAHTAIRAGLENTAGDFAVFLACDLQDPAELIPELAEKCQPPYDIVLAVRQKRDDKLKDRLFSKLFFMIMKAIASEKLPSEGSSMYMVSQNVVKALRKFPERNLTLESMFVLMNFKNARLFYNRSEREIGESKWTLGKKIKIFVDFLVAYSYGPIRFVSLMGISFAFLGFLWTFYIIFRALIWHDVASGWPALISVLLVGFGITNISLGIIAEYLWRTLDESRKRPIYIIERKLNFLE